MDRDHKHKDIEKSTHVKKSRCYYFDVRSQSGTNAVSRNYEGELIFEGFGGMI
jgi:hypothetical protein